MKLIRNEGFLFLLGDIVTIGLIRLVLYFFPINPKIGQIYLHHGYFGVFGIILSGVLLSFFLKGKRLRYLFSFVFGASFAATLDEFNLFILNGGGFVYANELTVALDIVALVLGALLYLTYIFLKRHE
ncbi:MAG: hypothetical protein QXP36_04140 [Conexivisphaerales archaeon]